MSLTTAIGSREKSDAGGTTRNGNAAKWTVIDCSCWGKNGKCKPIRIECLENRRSSRNHLRGPKIQCLIRNKAFTKTNCLCLPKKHARSIPDVDSQNRRRYSQNYWLCTQICLRLLVLRQTSKPGDLWFSSWKLTILEIREWNNVYNSADSCKIEGSILDFLICWIFAGHVPAYGPRIQQFGAFTSKQKY